MNPFYIADRTALSDADVAAVKKLMTAAAAAPPPAAPAVQAEVPGVVQTERKSSACLVL